MMIEAEENGKHGKPSPQPSPAVRGRVRSALSAALHCCAAPSGGEQPKKGGDDVIDAEFEVKD